MSGGNVIALCDYHSYPIFNAAKQHTSGSCIPLLGTYNTYTCSYVIETCIISQPTGADQFHTPRAPIARTIPIPPDLGCPKVGGTIVDRCIT